MTLIFIKLRPHKEATRTNLALVHLRFSTQKPDHDADHLLPYIEHPEDHDCVVKYDDEWVLIRDKFPKSVVHLLLLCRDPARYVRYSASLAVRWRH